MRRRELMAVSAAVLLGCSYRPPHLTTDGRAAIDPGNGQLAYVTGYEELRPLVGAQHVTYIGTWREYHIVRWWTKILPAPNAVACYAIPVDHFSPDHPFAYVTGNEWAGHPASPLFK